jgi:Bacterial Ig-like domain
VVDKSGPTLTAKTPTGTGVARNTNVSATFSESMDEASVEAAGTVKLVLVGIKGKTTLVAASVTYNPATRSVTLDPATNLGTKATYTVTITTAAKDVAGNALARPETWAFTTGAR